MTTERIPEEQRALEIKNLFDALQGIQLDAEGADTLVGDLRNEFPRVPKLLPCDLPIEDYTDDPKLILKLARQLEEADRKVDELYETACDLRRKADELRDGIEYAKHILGNLTATE